MKKNITIITLLSILFLSGCQEKQKSNMNQATPPKAIPAPIMRLKQTSVYQSYEYPARVKSINEAIVVSKVSGTLLKKSFIEGSFVKEGDELFRVDSRKYQANYDKAKAQVEIAKANLKNLEQNKKRIEALFLDKAVSEQERDNAIANYEVALAQLEAANALLNDASIDLDYTSIKAPISGFVGKKMVDIGNYVTPQMQLVKITQLDPIYVEFSIPDSELEKIRSLEEMVVKTKLDNGVELIGKIEFFDKTIDEKSGTIFVRAQFENKDFKLIPGAFIRVKLESKRSKEKLLIPQKAVIQSPNGTFVYIVEDNISKIRPVELGEIFGNNFEIKAGLEIDSKIIVDNIAKISPNIPIIPIEGK